MAAYGWRDGGDDPMPQTPPMKDYYGLEIWPGDPEWAGFLVDLSHEVINDQQSETMISNLAFEWMSRLGMAVKDTRIIKSPSAGAPGGSHELMADAVSVG